MMERKCACKSWDAAECVLLRYGTPNGYDPDEDDYIYSSGERCECECHEDHEYDDWEDE